MRAKEFRGLVANLARQGTLVEPRCPHAGECGGCAFQDRAYADQVEAKRAALARLFGAEGLLTDVASFTVVASPDPYNYRTRMDYVATKGRFGLRARGKFNYIIELNECHLIPPQAFLAAKATWEAAMALGLPDYNIRSHEGFLRYIVVRRSPADELLIALVTAAGPYEDAMQQLAVTALAQPGVVGCHWLLNASLTDLSFGTPLRHWGAELLNMHAGAARLVSGPNTFFQNNVHLLGRLLDDVRAATIEGERHPNAVADLYGGVGTLALHLAPHVGTVDCVEAVAESVALAARNADDNGISNFRAVFQDTLPFLQTQAAGTYDVVVADPPRIGLGLAVCTELLRLKPRRLVYVSCNPLTQIEDLRALASGYALVTLRGYDMFPHTPHVETLAILEQSTA